MLAQETTIVGSDASVKIQGTDIANRDNVLATYTLGSTDPFMVDGIQLGVFNISGQVITLTGNANSKLYIRKAPN